MSLKFCCGSYASFWTNYQIVYVLCVKVYVSEFYEIYGMVVLQLNKDQISVAEEVASRDGRKPSKMVNCLSVWKWSIGQSFYGNFLEL